MIKLLQECSVLVDNGSPCGDGCCWNPYWESENFSAGEELDDEDWKVDICHLEEGVDFIRID